MNTVGNARVFALLLAVSMALIEGMPAAAATMNLLNKTVDTTDALAVTYSPDSSARATGKVTVQKGSSSAGPFCVVLTFVSITPVISGGPAYGIYAPAASQTKLLSLTGSPTSSSQVLSGSFTAQDGYSATKILDYAFVLSPTVLPPPGAYTVVIMENLYASTYLPTGKVYDTNTLTVTMTVGACYDVSVVSTGSPFSLSTTSQGLNFGALSPGQSLGADILVRSNVSYSISLSSANGGSLLNALDATSQVGYALKANGVTVPLTAGPALIASGASATFSSPVRHGVSAIILPFVNLPTAGTYSDIITISVLSP